MRIRSIKTNNNSWHRAICGSGFFATVSLLSLGISLSFSGHFASDSAFAVGTISEVTVTIPDNLSLVVNNGSGGTDVSMTAAHATTGTVLKSGVTVTASTNNKTGYTLTFSDTDEDNNLVEINNSTLTIPTLSATVTEANFPEDKWGYNLNGGDFSPIPRLSAPATIEASTDPGTSTHTVEFATKISNSAPGGTYKDETIFSLVANYVPPAVTYIQDSIATWCSEQTTPAAFTTGTTINTSVPETTMLDKRDDEEYTIRKLADGNCWMTDNLRLGKTAITIDSTLSDVPSGTSFTLPVAQTSGTSSYDVLQVWSQNDSNTPIYGHYYNWYTATATQGTQNGVTGGAETSRSICPKGMTLPSSATITSTSTNGTVKNWNNLVQVYGITDDATGYAKISAAPLSFPLSGNFNSGWYNQGSYGNWWSRTSFPSYNNYAYNLYVYTTRVLPQYYNYKDYGFSVRCVSQ